MRIAVIGAGSVGRALGAGWAAKGHDIVFGVRGPAGEKARAAVAAAGPRARAATVAGAAADADVVLLATPWGDATADAIRAAGGLAGKIVIDATNPLAPDLSGLTVGHTDSAGETVQRWAPGAKVVKAFNTIGAQHMADPVVGGERATMLIAGDDAGAKATVRGLAEALGFDVVDAGPLAQARLLEPLAMLWISLAYAQGRGPNIAFRLLRG